MSADRKGTVLVTGANGFIAGRVVEAFLLAGYNVRGTVRSISSAKPLLAALENHAQRLEVVEVPDITAPGAFDEAVKGVDAVAHLASPVSLFFKDPDPVIKAAVEGTTSVLESAIKETSIKVFLYMSSIAAVTGQREGDYIYTEKDWNNVAEGLLQQLGKSAPGVIFYSVAKTTAEKAFWKFREERSPGFAMTSVDPVFVAGPPLAAPTSPDQINETTKFIWDILTGRDLVSSGLTATYHGYMDVRDVAKMCVFGVEHPEITNGERYLGSSGYGPPQAVADILRKAYPNRRHIIQEGNPGEGYFSDFRYPDKVVWDGSKTSRVMGLQYIPFDKTVLDTAKAFEALFSVPLGTSDSFTALKILLFPRKQNQNISPEARFVFPQQCENISIQYKPSNSDLKMADNGSHSDSEAPPGPKNPHETHDATNPGGATGAGDLVASLEGLTIGDAGSETPHSQDAFPLNKLPSEIREQIWEEAFKLASFLKKPRIIGIRFISRGGVSRIRVKEWFDIVQEDEFITGLRGACQDSAKHVVLKNPVDHRLRQLNFDLNTDIIFMSIRDLHWFGYELNVDDLYNTANFMADLMDVTLDLITSGAFQLVDHLGQGFAAIGPLTAEQQKMCDTAAENFFQLWRRQSSEDPGEERPGQKFIALLNSADLFAQKYRRYVRYGDLRIIPANRSFGFRADEYLLDDDFGSEWIIELKHKVDKLRKSWHLLRKSQYRHSVPDLYFAKINAIAGPTVIFNADVDE